MPAGGVGACPDNEPTRQATRQHTRSHRCEGRRRAVRGLAAVPVGGGGAWPGFETTRKHTSATQPHWCGGRRRVRRARAGFEIDHSERSSRVAISRAAGASGARNTSGATSNNRQHSHADTPFRA